MRKNTLPLLGIALTAFFAASNCFAQGVPAAPAASKSDQQDQVKTIFSFKNDIGLTDDQELKLKALLYDEQSSLDTDNTALKTLGTDLGKLVDDKADMAVIKSKLEEIAAIQVKVSYRNIEDSRKVEDILTPDQLTKWRAIQKQFSAPAK